MFAFLNQVIRHTSNYYITKEQCLQMNKDETGVKISL